MQEKKQEAPSKCAVCDSHDFQGTWKCECDAINISKNESCWKCRLPRPRKPQTP